MLQKFNQLSKLVKILLLLIPFVNWITEIVVRWSLYLEKKDTVSLVLALLATFFFGVLLGFIDAILILVKGDILTEETLK